MKKLIYFFLFFIPTISFCQFENLKVNIINGPNFGWMKANDSKVTTEGTKVGYKLHVEAERKLNDRFSITGGIGLALGQGGKLGYQKGGNLWSESTGKLNISRPDSLPDGVALGYGVNYVDFPIGFKMRTNDFGKFRFYAQLPEFSLGIKTGAKGSIEGSGVNSSKENINSQVTFINFFWGLGAGIEYKISDDIALIGGLRFYQSLIDVTDDSGRYRDNSKENSKGTINSLDVRIGVSF